MKTKEIKKIIQSIVKSAGYNPMRFKDFAYILDLHSKKEKQMLENLLLEMQKKGKLSKGSDGRYYDGKGADAITGILQGHSRGFAFLTPDDPSWQTDIFIPEHCMGDALDQDRVEVRLIRHSDHKRPEGEVVRVIERSDRKIIGVFEAHKDFGFLIADNLRLSRDIFIPARHTHGAQNGDKVVATITSWPEHGRNPEGKILEILGKEGDPSLDATALFREFEIPTTFPDSVEKLASELSLNDDHVHCRQDLTNLEVFTIDGDHAKDFDDAVSLGFTSDGQYCLGVHIADVSNYVRYQDAIDQEAFRRGTSVYAIDQVVPMLPFILSNDLCSLKPDCDRFCISCFMTINQEGQVTDHHLLKSRIHSKARMTYSQVNALFDGISSEATDQLTPFKETLNHMRDLAQILNQKRRRQRGSIDFDFPEAQITLDSKGFPESITTEERGISERLIEEFMLVANETVAEHILNLPMPFLFRNHESPDPEKIENFRKFIGRYGYHLGEPGESSVSPEDFTVLQNTIADRPEHEAFSYLMLRTMQQAVYEPENKGHYALGASYYTHFTSPIRRYPDLLVHRSLSAFLGDDLSKKHKSEMKKEIHSIATHCSETERRAESLERTLEKIKMTEYMSQYIGDIFEGTICSVTAFGFFVQLPNTIEGLVHVQNLDDDYYHYDESLNLFHGERFGKIYRLGQKITVRLIASDPSSKQIDFKPAKPSDFN